MEPSAPQNVAATEEVSATFDKFLDRKDVKFYFRTIKQKDENGKETGVETKRPDVNLSIPVPSVEGIIEILKKGGKGLELLQEAVAEVVISQARTIVNEREDVSQENFPLEKLDWQYIAELPKAQRRGGGIDKETWEDFVKDYIEVMPGATGKPMQSIEMGAKILLSKFNTVKSNKPVLKRMQELLTIYISHSANAESFAECVEFLNNKAETLLKISDEELLKNL